MLGDGHCDEVCDNSECDRDGHDCECATGCGYNDLASCKSECMVPECGYGRLPGHPSCDELRSTNELYAAIIHFNKTGYWHHPHFAYCYWCNGGEGTPECEVANIDICLKCREGLVNSIGWCSTSCSAGLSLHPALGNQCLPLNDASTPAHPDVLLVDESGEYTDYGQRLSFTSLSEAFASMKKQHTLILLNGSVVLIDLQRSRFLSRSWNYTGFTLTFEDRTFNITLRAACAGCRATVYLDSNEPPEFILTDEVFGDNYCGSPPLTGFFTVERVDFIMESSTIWPSWALFDIGAWKVRLANVSFRGVNGYYCIVKMPMSGDLIMTNVTFEDISVENVVMKLGDECPYEHRASGYLTYADGTVSAVHATSFFALENISEITISRITVQSVVMEDFLSATGVGGVVLSECRFLHNRVSAVFHVYPSFSSLAPYFFLYWHANSPTKADFLVTNCEFIGNQAIYCLFFDYGYLPQSVRVANCAFRDERETILSVDKYTPVQKSDINGVGRYLNGVRINADPIFVDLKNLTVQNCTVPLGLFTVANFSNLRVSDIAITEQNTAAFVFLKCFNVSVTRVLVSHSHCDDSLLVLNASAIAGGLSITSVLVTQSSGGNMIFVSAVDTTTFSNLTVASSAFAHFIKTTYADTVTLRSCRFESNEASGGMLLCNAKLCLVEDTRFAQNRVGSGGVVQLQTSNTQETSLVARNVLFYQNQGAGAIVLVQSSLTYQHSQLVLQYLNFTGNTAEIAIVLTSESTVLANGSKIEDCHFLRNSAGKGVVDMRYEQGVLSILQTHFRENEGDVVRFAHSSVSQSPELHIANADFADNMGSAVYIRNSLSQSILSVSSSKFANCLSTSVVLQNVLGTVSNCTFQKNTGVAGGALALEQGSTVRIDSCKFSLNSAAGKGGAVAVAEGSGLTCSHCTFAGNTAVSAGGAIYISPGASVNLSHSLFEENAALDGSAIYSLMSAASVADTCEFRHNRAGEEATIAMFFSALTLRNCTLQENYSGQFTPGVVLNLSNLTIELSTFRSHNGLIGTLLHATMRSIVNISDSQFSETESQSGAIYVDDTVIDISNSTFQSMSADFGSVITAVRNSLLYFSDNIVERHSNNRGGVLYILQSSCSVFASYFSALISSAVYSKGANIALKSSRFYCNFHIDVTALKGGGLYCEDCERVTISECTFIKLRAKSGAGVHLSGTTGVTFSIEKSTFQGNNAGESAGIHAEVAALKIKHCVFVNNEADTRGGALTLQCTGTCLQSVQHNRFVINKAGNLGGAICWQSGTATFVNNTFDANTAPYGPDVSSFPSTLFLLTTSFPAVASGQLFPSQIVVEVRDNYNQAVLVDNSTTAELSVRNAEIYGGVKTTASMGKLIFSSFSVVGQLNATILISSVELQSEIEIDIAFRNCVIGEFRTKDRCVVCGPGMYSLDISQPCTKCDKNADCPGTYFLIPRQGYWRPSNYSTQLLQCPNPDACLGPPNPTGTCAEGYTGNMCQTCAVGYVRYAKTQCQPCPSESSVLLVTVGVATGALLFSVVLVISTIKSAYKEKSQMSLSLKVLMNYLQLVMLMGAFNLSWPHLTKRLLSIQDSAGGFSEQIFAPGCLRSSYDENEDFYWKVVAMAFVPLAVMALSSVLWALWALCRRQASILSNELVGSATILFFLVHSSVIKVMFSALNCEEVGGEYWVVGLKQRCWQGDHWKYAVATALPSLLLWGVAVPTLVLLFMSRQKTKLRELQARVRFGFLFNGYNPEQYYWEFVIIYRKLLVISLAVFLSRLSPVIPALSALAVLMFSFSLQEAYKPFRHAAFNALEKRSLFVSTLTLFCGLYFLFGGLDAITETAFFGVIVGVNVHFLQYWVRTTFKTLAAKVVKSLPCLERCFVVLGEDKVLTNKQFQETRKLIKGKRPSLSPSLKKLFFERINRQLA